MSPAMAAAAAVTGRLTDVREMTDPSPARGGLILGDEAEPSDFIVYVDESGSPNLNAGSGGFPDLRSGVPDG